MISWRKCQSTHFTDAEIIRLWTKYPGANIGVVTGPISKLFVLDIDGEEGKQSLTGKEMPKTPTSSTGGGGVHYLFQHVDGKKNTIRFLPGLDTRGEGGYIVAAPSSHKSGNVYAWDVSPFDQAVAAAPLWLTQALADKPRARSNKKNWDDIVKAGSPEGCRNDVMASYCGYLLNQGYNNNEVLQNLREMDLSNKPPMGDVEVQKIFHSIYGRHLQSHRGAAYEIATAVKPTMISAADFMSEAVPPPRWLIEDIWAEEGIGLIAAIPKSYKSLLSLLLAISVVTGKDFLGKHKVPNSGPVILVCEEGKKHELQRSLQLLCNGVGVSKGDVKDLHIRCQNRVNVTDPDWQRELIVNCLDKKARLIIFDPLRHVCDIDENSSSEVSRVTSYFRRIQVEAHCSVMVLHHAKKADEETYKKTRTGNLLRGSSELYAFTDSLMSLYKRDNIVKVTIEHRDAQEPPPFHLKFNPTGNDIKFTGITGTLDDYKAAEKKEKLYEYISKHPGAIKDDLRAVLPSNTDRQAAIRKLCDEGRIHRYTEKRIAKNGKDMDMTVFKIAADSPQSSLAIRSG